MAFHVFFLTLIIVNVVRTLRHPMWRAEMGTFQIARSSASLWELLPKLQYPTHPALWYSLVWLPTRFTSDPTSMAILHIVISIAVWTLIFRWSPFETVEKCLLPLSYFLFWEYFVISRNYALLALIGFAFVALQQHAGFACEHACAGRHLVDRAGKHIRHKAGAPDTAVRNRCGDLPRPPGVLGQDSSAGAGFWTMGYGRSVRCGPIRLHPPASLGPLSPHPPPLPP